MIQRRALVLGSGPLASAMADDLERTRDVRVARLAGFDASRDAGALSEQDVVLSALTAEGAASVLRALLEARLLVADANGGSDDALALESLAVDKRVAACVGSGDALARLLLEGPAPADARTAALLTTALARRLLTGDFRDHWGIWTPERLVARVGMAHGLRQDLRERGVALR